MEALFEILGALIFGLMDCIHPPKAIWSILYAILVIGVILAFIAGAGMLSRGVSAGRWVVQISGIFAVVSAVMGIDRWDETHSGRKKK